MKKISYKDIEDSLDGEMISLNGEKVQKNKKFSETLELFTLLKNLPEAPAPQDFERSLYRKLGISFVPLYRKVLTLTGLSVFSAFGYLTGHTLVRLISPKITLTTVSQFFSQVYAKLAQIVSLIKVGQHLKDILLVFTNPWLFVSLAFVSSILLFILIGLSREVKKSAVLLRRFNY